MNYKGKKVAVSGPTGFIGKALFEKLEDLGAEVFPILLDVRRNAAYQFLDHSFDYLFHFGAPSSQVQFARDSEYCVDVTINGFLNAFRACQEYGIKLIYPSTGLLSQGKENEYARCKAICESIAAGSDALGIRIFATYGPGEGHKRDYASVPYLFARDMAENRRSVVFGDGEQKRDFIYIGDVVEGVLTLAERCNDPVVDLGSGVATSFNQLLSELGATEVDFIPRPNHYVDATLSQPNQHYSPKVTFKEGIKKLQESFK